MITRKTFIIALMILIVLSLLILVVWLFTKSDKTNDENTFIFEDKLVVEETDNVIKINDEKVIFSYLDRESNVFYYYLESENAFKSFDLKNNQKSTLFSLGKAQEVVNVEWYSKYSVVIYDFKKTNEEKVKFLGGILENKYLKEEEVEELAQIPSKNELYAKIVGSINAPVSGFVNALSGNLKNLVYVLKAVEEKKA